MPIAHAKMRFNILFLFLMMIVIGQHACVAEDFSSQREAMLAEIQQTVSDTSGYIGKKSLDERVMSAIGEVPRHEFIPKYLWSSAYLNRPLPIGSEQTISQPYIVALMTDLAEIDSSSIVLEVGTGSGYQAAVLAKLVKHVYTIEIIEKLGKQAEQTLSRLGYHNVSVKIGDGYHGWIEHAPFDAILVTAAPEYVPAPLIKQLKPGGKLIIPVARQYSSQSLQVIEKDLSGAIHEHDVLPVRFVPLTGEH